MKNSNIVLKNKLCNYTRIAFIMVLSIIGLSACEQDLPNDIAVAGPLVVTASNSEIVLNQKSASNKALSLTWTTGSNNATGASISYILEIDKKGNNFSSAIRFDMGKGVYSKELNVKELNDNLLQSWGFAAGNVAEIEARVISTIYSIPQNEETSPIISFNVTPYEPVSTTLYIIGDALADGWDAENALALTAQDDPTQFVYQGVLSVGSFKFIINKGELLPSYNKGADDSKIVYRTDDSQPDDKFSISEAGVYKVVVNLLDLSINFGKVDLPAYNEIYMVGSAAPNGWDIANATELTQSTTDPFVFTYQGVMNAGEFKFPVNRNTDWGQDMYMYLSDTEMYLHRGGTDGDDKWTINKKGYYSITLNLYDNSISINRQKLYMVGSASSIGWDIGQAIELTEDEADGCIFIYSGPMLEGEFKLPVNRDSSWGQDMYMRTSDTEMYRHIGGQSDDNKWSIVSAGNYIIRANIETLDISIVKQ